MRVWEAVRELTGGGVTVLLTTQYLDEADALADRIVVIDHGRVIANGTPQELKEASRSARLEVTLAGAYPGAAEAIGSLTVGQVRISDDGQRLDPGVGSMPGLATSVVGALDAAGVLVNNVEVRQPSLDDVFFSLTGGRLAAQVASPGNGADGAKGSRPELEGARA